MTPAEFLPLAAAAVLVGALIGLAFAAWLTREGGAGKP